VSPRRQVSESRDVLRRLAKASKLRDAKMMKLLRSKSFDNVATRTNSGYTEANFFRDWNTILKGDENIPLGELPKNLVSQSGNGVGSAGFLQRCV